jgi:L-ascorbate metabolism protein UlaG (beta-lactamase superfamily)
MLRSILAASVLLVAAAAMAQETEPERCPRLVAWNELVVPARFSVAQAEAAEVKLTFLGHASFLIESPAGVTIVTDYNDGVGIPVVPRIATMNRAHITHYSLSPDPGIEHVLPGWGENGVAASHELTVNDVWLRNVTTNIRGGFGMSGALQRDMNSIFVFEVAGLCIAHLGHLHHTLTPEHLKALGRIDVVLVPVDGSYTLNVEDMIKVLESINAPMVIPMHYFGSMTLQRFLDRFDDDYAIVTNPTPTTTLSRSTMPKRATVLVLPGY